MVFVLSKSLYLTSFIVRWFLRLNLVKRSDRVCCKRKTGMNASWINYCCFVTSFDLEFARNNRKLIVIMHFSKYLFYVGLKFLVNIWNYSLHLCSWWIIVFWVWKNGKDLVNKLLSWFTHIRLLFIILSLKSFHSLSSDIHVSRVNNYVKIWIFYDNSWYILVCVFLEINAYLYILAI